MSTYSQLSFSSSTWKRDGVWMYRVKSRPGHSTVVSIYISETVLRCLRDRAVGMARLVGGEHMGMMGDAVCGRDCCC